MGPQKGGAKKKPPANKKPRGKKGPGNQKAKAKPGAAKKGAANNKAPVGDKKGANQKGGGKKGAGGNKKAANDAAQDAAEGGGAGMGGWFNFGGLQGNNGGGGMKGDAQGAKAGDKKAVGKNPFIGSSVEGRDDENVTNGSKKKTGHRRRTVDSFTGRPVLSPTLLQKTTKEEPIEGFENNFRAICLFYICIALLIACMVAYAFVSQTSPPDRSKRSTERTTKSRKPLPSRGPGERFMDATPQSFKLIFFERQQSRGPQSSQPVSRLSVDATHSTNNLFTNVDKLIEIDKTLRQVSPASHIQGTIETHSIKLSTSNSIKFRDEG